MKIYTITTVCKTLNESRCIGYYTSMKKAQQAVDYNLGDMHEDGFYPYVVIEKIEPGLYQYDLHPVLYQWDEELNRYIQITSPHALNDRIGYSIG